MIKKTFINTVSMMIAVVFALGFSLQAQAANCKGKSQSSCAASASCTWVKGYKRSDGVKVSGHCRNKSGKASAFGKQSADKAKTKKDKLKKDAKTKKDKKKKSAKDKAEKVKSKKDKK